MQLNLWIKNLTGMEWIFLKKKRKKEQRTVNITSTLTLDTPFHSEALFFRLQCSAVAVVRPTYTFFFCFKMFFLSVTYIHMQFVPSLGWRYQNLTEILWKKTRFRWVHYVISEISTHSITENKWKEKKQQA